MASIRGAAQARAHTLEVESPRAENSARACDAEARATRILARIDHFSEPKRGTMLARLCDRFGLPAPKTQDGRVALAEMQTAREAMIARAHMSGRPGLLRPDFLPTPLKLAARPTLARWRAQGDVALARRQIYDDGTFAQMKKILESHRPSSAAQPLVAEALRTAAAIEHSAEAVAGAPHRRWLSYEKYLCFANHFDLCFSEKYRAVYGPAARNNMEESVREVLDKAPFLLVVPTFASFDATDFLYAPAVDMFQVRTEPVAKFDGFEKNGEGGEECDPAPFGRHDRNHGLQREQVIFYRVSGHAFLGAHPVSPTQLDRMQVQNYIVAGQGALIDRLKDDMSIVRNRDRRRTLEVAANFIQRETTTLQLDAKGLLQFLRWDSDEGRYFREWLADPQLGRANFKNGLNPDYDGAIKWLERWAGKHADLLRDHE
jgi:hypothetical protein